ncbi:hypothetical protein CXF67_04490 [Psychroflexus sp. MES1-P1E]|nr:hypothetical protein CXF67_04490 [Psychroflexus sp. MES1-P1E]
MPQVGSYFLICLDELISSETEILTLEIYWLELPKDLAEYYNGYEPDFSFNNLSHQVNFSIGLNDNYYLINRHTLSLFNENKSTGCILQLSKFYLNIKGVLSSNHFLYINKNKDSSERFKDRIKMELISPDIAFGHHLFSQLYSSIAMKNTRLLSQKYNLPNPPFSPVAKKIIMYDSLK